MLENETLSIRYLIWRFYGKDNKDLNDRRFVYFVEYSVEKVKKANEEIVFELLF